MNRSISTAWQNLEAGVRVETTYKVVIPCGSKVTTRVSQQVVPYNNGAKSPIISVMSVDQLLPPTNCLFCSQSITLGDVYVMNKNMSIKQRKFVDILGQGL